MLFFVVFRFMKFSAARIETDRFQIRSKFLGFICVFQYVFFKLLLINSMKSYMYVYISKILCLKHTVGILFEGTFWKKLQLVSFVCYYRTQIIWGKKGKNIFVKALKSAWFSSVLPGVSLTQVLVWCECVMLEEKLIALCLHLNSIFPIVLRPIKQKSSWKMVA